jgi:N-methylhydantoinase B/oxoprolinase/acetone carboxylase alpha subunit
LQNVIDDLRTENASLQKKLIEMEREDQQRQVLHDFDGSHLDSMTSMNAVVV